ncbi:MAG TPA: DUF1564 family protein, partial [Leptospiraceae bacterium]|nr:DUF1564 family protein [Leptospiraceae bacterium]
SENRKSSIIMQNKISFPNKNFNLEDFCSTLLIPERYIKVFVKKVNQHEGVREYVSYLLAKYQIYIVNGLIPGYSNVTTKYQEKGQNLQRVSFRPDATDWAELKIYRLTFGMSISAFIVYLLIADSVEFEKTVSNIFDIVGILEMAILNLDARVSLSNNRTNYSIHLHYRQNLQSTY